MTHRYWTSPASKDRVGVEDLANITVGWVPPLLVVAYRRSAVLPPRIAGDLAGELIRNLDLWGKNLQQTGVANTGPAEDFVHSAAQWLREAATHNQLVECSVGDGPFEVVPDSPNLAGPTMESMAALPTESNIGSPEVRAGHTLARYTNVIAIDEEYDWVVRQLISGFYANIYRQGTLEERIFLISEAPALRSDIRFNAFVAALAVHLATQDEFAVPKWAQDPTRAQRLEKPFYPDTEHLPRRRDRVHQHSPKAFADLNIFIDGTEIPPALTETEHGLLLMSPERNEPQL